MGRFGWGKTSMEIVDIASQYSETILSGEQRRVSVYEQRSKVKLKELIEVGSSGMPPVARGGEDFLAILSNKIKNNKYIRTFGKILIEILFGSVLVIAEILLSSLL